ncbi:MAG TPA: methyltransferase domain-containing protein, partial [Longimicrobiaceae bacterium]|nr:methyltransferase domain-containing protein [Longimicrobiaceae bacterium]
WPSARALAREVLEAHTLPNPVLELGCGIGLPSLAAAWRDVHVLASDFYGDALLFTRTNAARNHVAGVETRVLDWRYLPPNIPAFPLVLAADVLYEARNVEPLASALERLVAPAGEAWLADPHRVYLSPFLERLGNRGWRTIADAVREEPNEGDPDRPARVRIIRLRRPPGS